MHNNEWKTVPVKYLIDYSGTPSSAPIKNMASPEKIDNYYPAYSASGQDVWLPNYMFDCDAIVISAVGARCGKTFLAKGKFGVCANTHVLKVKKTCCSRFLNYILNDEAWWIKGGSAQPFVKVSDSLRQKIVVPDLEYQMEVADFLDDKCAEIDRLSEDIQKQIDILNDYKKSVITRAVTKGLDPNAEMKDSGIEWIGKIPKKWEVLRIKNLGSARNGLTYSPNDLTDEENGVLVLRSANVQDGKIALDNNVYVSCRIPNNLMVKKGDILICSRNGSRELIGKNAIINDIYATYGAFMMVYRSNDPEFLYYVLNSEVFSYYLGTFFTSTINQLTSQNFNNMKIVFCPDKLERQKIVDYLKAKTADIDDSIEIKRKQLENLNTYKKSIIYEYVTGKKRVV